MINANEPLPLEITPANVVLVPSKPTVKLFAPEVLVVIVPLPAMEPIVSEALTLNVVPESNVTAVLSLKLPVTVNVPAKTVVVPV